MTVGYPLLQGTGSPLEPKQPCSLRMSRSFIHPQHDGGWSSQAGVGLPQKGHFFCPVIYSGFYLLDQLQGSI